MEYLCLHDKEANVNVLNLVATNSSVLPIGGFQLG